MIPVFQMEHNTVCNQKTNSGSTTLLQHFDVDIAVTSSFPRFSTDSLPSQIPLGCVDRSRLGEPASWIAASSPGSLVWGIASFRLERSRTSDEDMAFQAPTRVYHLRYSRGDRLRHLCTARMAHITTLTYAAPWFLSNQGRGLTRASP